MAKFYEGNRAQNIVEMRRARALNGWKEGDAVVAFFGGRRCIEVWWEDATDAGRAAELAQRIFVHQDKNGRWVKD